MSAIIESESRYPGLPQPPPVSAQARDYANALLSAWVDEETISVRTVRKLLADTYDIGRTVGAMDAILRVRR